jgi:TolA-binding protein
VGGPDGAKDDPIRVFNRARDRLRAGDVSGGIEALRRFAAAAPNHSYADNALTLVGHAQFERAQFAAALQTFRMVLERFPTGNRVPQALLMTGLSLKKLGRVAEGRDTLGRLRAIYPDSAAAKRAAEEMARAQGRM